jgi:hypothetical protein
VQKEITTKSRPSIYKTKEPHQRNQLPRKYSKEVKDYLCTGEELGTSPLNGRLDAQEVQESNTKEIELHSRTGTHNTN